MLKICLQERFLAEKENRHEKNHSGIINGIYVRQPFRLRRKEETASPEDAIAPYIEEYVKLICRQKERIYDEKYDSLYIGDILKNSDGNYDVTGVFGTVNEDGETKDYAFFITATYYSDGSVKLREDTCSEINAKYLP